MACRCGTIPKVTPQKVAVRKPPVKKVAPTSAHQQSQVHHKAVSARSRQLSVAAKAAATKKAQGCNCGTRKK